MKADSVVWCDRSATGARTGRVPTSSGGTPGGKEGESPGLGPPLSCLSLVQAVPMVALECELTLAGRLAPLAPLAPSVELTAPPPFLGPAVISSTVGEEEEVVVGVEGGSQPCPVVSSSSPRLGCKRKLSVCQPEASDCGQAGEGSCTCNGHVGTGVTCGRCGEECSTEHSACKKRRQSRPPDLAVPHDVAVLQHGPDGAQHVQHAQHADLDVGNNVDVLTHPGGLGEEGDVGEQGLEVVDTSTNLSQLDAREGPLHAAVDITGGEEGGHLQVVVDSSACLTQEDSREGAVHVMMDTPSVGVSERGPVHAAVDIHRNLTPDDSEHCLMDDYPDSVAEVDVVGDDDNDNPSHHLPLPHPYSPFPTTLHRDDSSDDGDNDDDPFLLDDAEGDLQHRPAGLGPLLNTPKQRREERRRVLRLSVHKMRAVEDPEAFLRRSVLINNTMKRLQRELREEKARCGTGPRRGGPYRRTYDDVLNTSYLPLGEEALAVGEDDRITDDMTEALVTRLEATSSQVVLTPSPSLSPSLSPSPCPLLHEPDSLLEGASSTSSPYEDLSPLSGSGSDDVSSTVADGTSACFLSPAGIEQCPSVPQGQGQDLPCSVSPRPKAVTTAVTEDLTSPTSDVTSPVSVMTSDISSSSSFCPSSCEEGCEGVLEGGCEGVSESGCAGVSEGGCEGVLGVCGAVSEGQTHRSSCSIQTHKEKQLYADIDVVFNNLIHALGDS